MKTRRFECPGCQQMIECPATMAGEKLQCPTCGHEFVAPGGPVRSTPSAWPPGTVVLAVVFALYMFIFACVLRQHREDNLVRLMGGGGSGEPSEAFLLWLLVWGIVCSLVGFLIGKSRGKQRLGAALGIAFGPIGWLITLCSADLRPRCLECGGVVVEGARKCMHCSSTLNRMFDVRCPACGEQLQVPDSRMSEQIECPTCKRVFAAANARV